MFIINIPEQRVDHNHSSVHILQIIWNSESGSGLGFLRKIEAQAYHAQICPKCGYDQSGEIATWESECPVQGRCPECGLELSWSDVFDPQLNQIHWYVEHTKSLRSMIYRTPKTLWMLVFPHRFWGQLGVTRRVSIPRLLVWSLMVIIFMHLLVAIPNGYSHWYRIYKGSGLSFIEFNQWRNIPENIFNGIASPYFKLFGFSFSSIHRGWSGAWYEYLLKPMSFQFGFILFWMLVFAVIPQTRRLAKIRNAHLARAVILSFTVFVLSYEFHRLNIVMYELGWVPRFVFRYSQDWIVRILTVWQLLFWTTAIVVGWQIRPWKALVILGTITALLGALAVKVFVFLGFGT
jgi:hypothetical protein